jgi:hypothetical protein
VCADRSARPQAQSRYEIDGEYLCRNRAVQRRPPGPIGLERVPRQQRDHRPVLRRAGLITLYQPDEGLGGDLILYVTRHIRLLARWLHEQSIRQRGRGDRRRSMHLLPAAVDRLRGRAQGILSSAQAAYLPAVPPARGKLHGA